MTEREYKLALALIPGVGYQSYQKGIAHFGNAQQVLSATKSELKLSKAFDSRALANFNDNIWQVLDLHLEWANAENQTILHMQDEQFPQDLLNLDTPPMFLMCKGNVSLLNEPQIAMVGARNCSKIGKDIAYNFAADFAVNGLTVTSGMALGIDSAAHWGALSKKGDTIAVFGNAIDRIYPSSNSKLYQEITTKSLAISEFPLGTPPLAQNFPRRNRVITAISKALVVVEAKIASGTMTSAKHAMSQGKDIFAIPGSINNPLAKGCHYLIKQGGNLADSVDDIMFALSSQLKTYLENSEPASSSQPKVIEKTKNIDTIRLKQTQNETNNIFDQQNQLDDLQKKILQVVEFSPTALEDIVVNSKLSVEKCQSALMILELSGFVSSLSAGFFQRIK